MQKINLAKLIEDKHLDKKEMAEQLFPTNKFPRRALDRVVAGEGLLDADQISKLSLMCDIPINELFGQGHWLQASKGKKVFLTSGDYTAEYDHTTGVTKIFHKKSLAHESILSKNLMVLTEYLNELDLIINKL